MTARRHFRRIEPLENRIAPAFAAVIEVNTLDGLRGFSASSAGDENLGFSVTEIGDFNGDGKADFAIGAPDADTAGGVNSGAVYVAFGDAGGFPANLNLATLDGTNGFKIIGENGGDTAGFHLAGGGDVNGDSVPDLILGAPQAANSAGGNAAGKTYVVFGSASGFLAEFDLANIAFATGRVIEGAGGGDKSGAAVAYAGDFNNDGIGDFLVGAPDSPTNGAGSGAAYLIYGGASFPSPLSLASFSSVDGIVFHGEAAGDHLGSSVAGIGDFNQSAIPDIAIGARDAATGAGKTYVVFGTTAGFAMPFDLPMMDGTDGFIITGQSPGDASGSALGAADINNDNRTDLIIGAPLRDSNGTDSGSTYIVLGVQGDYPTAALGLGALNGGNGFSFFGQGAGHRFGSSVAGLPDIGDDMFADILIGAPNDDIHGADTGSAYVIFGKGTAFPATNSVGALGGDKGFKLQGNTAGSLVGISVSSAGDVNLDGLNDIIIGAPTSSAAAERAYILYGSPSAGDMDVTIEAGLLEIRDTPGARSAANLTFTLSGANLRIEDSGAKFNVGVGVTQIASNIVEVPLASVTDVFNFFGGIAVDQLTIDFANGTPLPATAFTFDGEDGDDELTITGADGVPISHIISGNNVNPAPGAEILINGRSINYVNIAKVRDLSAASSVSFGFSNEDHTLAVSQGGGGFRVDTDISGTIIEFAPTTPVLAFVFGGGNDTATFNQFPSAFTGTFGVNGGAGDDAFVFNATPITTANLGIDGGTGSNLLNFTTALGAVNLLATGISTLAPLPSLAPLALVDFDSLAVQFGSGAISSFSISGTSATPFVGQFRNSNPGSTLDVSGAVLALSTTLAGVAANPVILFDNRGSGPVLGILHTLGGDDIFEGAIIEVGTGRYALTYLGGDGNDIALLPQFSPPGDIKLGSGDGTDGFTLFGPEDGSKAGATVSTAGDINDDGFDDFIVAAPETDASENTDSGTVYVVFGKANGFPAELSLSSLNAAEGFRVDGSTAFNFAGISASGGGDVNGDFTDDLILSIRGSGGVDGATYVIFGGGTYGAVFSVTNLTGSDGFAIFGDAAAPHNGSAALAGDVNGDGKTDILIGGGASARVVFGAETFQPTLQLSALDGTNGFQILSAERATFGRAVAAAGDVNGDGIGDIIIGAPEASSIGESNFLTTGAAYVVFGSRKTFPQIIEADDLDGRRGFHIFGGIPFALFGASVAGAGDMNDDGFDDIIVGAPNENDAAGAAYVVFGKRTPPALVETSGLNGTKGFLRIGNSSTANLGASVSAAGDFNGDGFADILVGAPGQAFLIFGRGGGYAPTLDPATLNATTGFKLTGQPGDLAGFAVGTAGDINNDGFADIIIGAPDHETDSGFIGAAHVIFGFATQALPSFKGSATVIFDDVDGDQIRITITGGKANADMFTFGTDGTLQLVDLEAGGTLKRGASITFSVKRLGGGDGTINVGAIKAGGLILGTIKVSGDLGQIDIGTGDPAKNVLRALIVGSLGAMGGSTQIPGTPDPLESNILGSIPLLKVLGDFSNATFDVLGKIGNVTIVGQFSGTGAFEAAQLAALGRDPLAGVAGGQTLASSGVVAGNIGSLNVKQSISNAAVRSSGSIGSVNVNGSVNKSAIVAAGAIRVVKVFGAISSDDPNIPSVVAALAAPLSSKPAGAVGINVLSVRGNVENAEILVGYNSSFAPTNPDASIGKVVIKGNMIASSLAVGIADSGDDGFGRNDALISGDTTPKILARIATLIIKGTVEGSPENATDSFGIVAQQIGSARINNVKFTLDKLLQDDIALGTGGDFRLREVV